MCQFISCKKALLCVRIGSPKRDYSSVISAPWYKHRNSAVHQIHVTRLTRKGAANTKRSQDSAHYPDMATFQDSPDISNSQDSTRPDISKYQDRHELSPYIQKLGQISETIISYKYESLLIAKNHLQFYSDHIFSKTLLFGQFLYSNKDQYRI